MGLIYWNILNTLIKNDDFNNKFVFSINHIDDVCEMYYCDLNDFIKLFNVKKSITFKQPKMQFIKKFGIKVDDFKPVDVEINKFNKLNRKLIIKYKDNLDKPMNNKTQMYHSPILIINQTIIKLPKNNILTFEIKNSMLVPTFEMEQLKTLKHVNYALCTTFHKEIRTLTTFKCILSYDNNYEQYLTDNTTKKDEYEFSLKFIK